MNKVVFNIANFREFKDSYKKEVIQNNIGKTIHEIDVILEEMYIAYINRELNVNVSTLKEAKRIRKVAYKKEYYAANKDEIAAYIKDYRAANEEKIAAYRKDYYAANKDKIVALNKDYYAANKEKIAARKKRKRNS